MELLSSEALILDVIDLHEVDRIAVFLTRERGKKRGVARGARRKYSRFAGQLQPLAKVRVTWFEKQERDLVRISSMELIQPASALQGDLEGILLGGYLADHMMEFAQENEPTDELFRLLDSTLRELLAGIDRNLAARYYEAWVLRLSGVFPAPRECPLCERDLAQAGAILPTAGEALVCGGCASGGGGLEVAAETLDFLRRIGRESLRQVAARPPSPATLAQCEEISARVRRHFLQRELRSYQVMRETLAGIGE